MVADHHFECRSGSLLNLGQIGSSGHQKTQTVNSGRVQWKSSNPSELGGLSACVHVRIHIMLSFLLLDNSILPKSLFQHPVITFCRFCSLWYWLFWNPRFSLYILHFYLSSRSIVLLWARISVRFLDYPTCKTKNHRHLVDAHFHDVARRMSLKFLPL